MPESVESPSPEDHFAANLRRLREHRGMSQEALAKQMSARGYKWHQATVYKIETKERRVQLGEATAVAAILGVPLDKMAEDGTDIIELSEIKSLLTELEDLRSRLERNAQAYEGTRMRLNQHMDTDEPWGSAKPSVLSMLTDEERSAIKQAIQVTATDVASQPPF